MLAAAALPSLPMPTATATIASTFVQALSPRQTDLFGGYDAGCYNAVFSCATLLNGCYSNFLDVSDYEAAATSCLCNSGMNYLGCAVTAMDKACGGGLGDFDWNSYQMSYFQETCGSIPITAMAQMSQPTSVSLKFQTVKVVTASGKIEQPPPPPPIFKGSGELLVDECTSTDFTLVDAGETVYYAGFNGCNGDRPQCCPWSVTSAASPEPSGGGGTNQDTQNRIGFEFPQPADNAQAVLANCAADYYSVSGGCCPAGYWLFTTEVGGQTPCYKSINNMATVPTLTAGLAGQPSDTAQPTSAVVNIVWSMRYPVADSGSGGLSTAAKAGIGAGAGVAAILIGVLAICLWRSRRKTKKLQSEKTAQSQVPQGTQQTGAYPFPGPPPAPGTGSPYHTTPGTMSVSTASALIAQNTGTSNGGVSEMSSQGVPGSTHNSQHGGYFPAGQRVSYVGPNGTTSPVAGNGAYPAPIAEQDENHQQYGYPPSGYPQQQPPPAPQQQQFYPPSQQMSPQGQPYWPQQQQQQQQQPLMYAQPPPPGAHPYQQAPGGYPTPPPQQSYPPPQHAYPPQPLVPQYNANVPEMSAGREIDPPQEVAGSQIR